MLEEDWKVRYEVDEAPPCPKCKVGYVIRVHGSHGFCRKCAEPFDNIYDLRKKHEAQRVQTAS